MNLDQLLKTRRVLITCGTGGVGKTTMSAALAIRAATLGLRSVVITVDPAKRLATSLGLKGHCTLGNQATDLTDRLQTHFPDMKGQFSAIIPDTRHTFETLVETLAPYPEFPDKIKANPVFQMISKELSGSSEYVALLRLIQLNDSNEFDLIILDTPPSRHTAAFLQAPYLLGRFYEEKVIRWIVLPANQVISSGMKKVLSILEHLTGKGFVTHLFEFTRGMFEIQPGFSSSLEKIVSLFRSDSVGFLMVTTPSPETLPELLDLSRQLHEKNYHWDGVILNRSVGSFNLEEDESGGQSSPWKSALQIIRAIQAQEKQVEGQLENARSTILAKLPELVRDVHSIGDLAHVARALAPTSPSPS